MNERQTLFESYDDIYVNVHSTNNGNVIHIPCSSKEDKFGFNILGIKEEKRCYHPYLSILALVYNFFIRCSSVNIDKIFNLNTLVYNHNYNIVFKYIIIFLQMFKNNYIEKDIIFVNIIDYKAEATKAVEYINEYLKIFCELAGVPTLSIKLKLDTNGTKIRFTKIKFNELSQKNICVVPCKSKANMERKMWYGSKIKYNLTKKHKLLFLKLLHSISDFTEFKEGQFEAICSMINANDHAVCIMPTGSGKSLIYYFASMLQPMCTFVVSPTDILIKDQIINLFKYYGYDNVSHLMLNGNYDFERYEMGTNLVYLTPTTFQNKNLFKSFWAEDNKSKIAYIILDEIHCLSNWGHDFRPEYLMLSKNLKKYLEQTSFLGFTATANYTVVKDIQKQLGIKQDNFISPITYEKYLINYEFCEADDTKDMYRIIKKIISEISYKNERALIFTKNDEITDKIVEIIGSDAESFTKKENNSYQNFVDGKCNFLVSNGDLGIGIDFSNVNCVINFGMPLSKNEFIQQVGRAGRNNEKVNSYVVFLKPSEDNIPLRLLRRETDIGDIGNDLNEYDNDYSYCYRKISNDVFSRDDLYNNIISLFNELQAGNSAFCIKKYDSVSAEVKKKYLYMLFVTGYIADWYTYSFNYDYEEIMIDISSTNHIYYSKEKNLIKRMKEKTSSYLEFMSENKDNDDIISKAESMEEILKIYVNWYYGQYLYRQKEQFLDMIEFLLSNRDENSEKITNSIQEYFSLPFSKIKNDERYYLELTFEEISQKLENGIGKSKLANIERILSNKYDYKLDYLLFIGNWIMNGSFDYKRLERFWYKLKTSEKQSFQDTVSRVYHKCDENKKYVFLKYLCSDDNITNIQFYKFIDKLYFHIPKDLAYYGILAKRANEVFKKRITKG